MDTIYNSYFFNDFYAENGGGSYLDKEHWSPFFDSVAKQIVSKFAPKTVLDAGCATGYLVSALRKLGVEAWGIDISEYAISKGDEEIKDYLAVASITERLPESFPEKFDLVITIEVLEHLFPADGAAAIANLCSLTDTVIFTSTPTDIEDRTHCNVQQPEYWAKIFAENGFYHDLMQSADFICSYAMVLRRRESIPNVIFDYELNRRIDEMQFEKHLKSSRGESALYTVYFDMGNGFVQDSAVSVLHEGLVQTGHIAVPSGCKHIRFDPVDGKFALVSELYALTNIGEIAVAASNALCKTDKFAFFDNTDPQFVFVCTEEITWVEIKCQVISFSHEPDYRVLKAMADESTRLYDESLNCKMKLSELEDKNARNEAWLEKTKEDLATYKSHYSSAMEQKRIVEADLANMTLSYNTIRNSGFWKITAPARKLLDGIKWLLKKFVVTRLIGKGLVSLKRDGFRATWSRVRSKFSSKYRLNKIAKSYYTISDDERRAQKEAVFNKDIKFSILVPLYNTDLGFIDEMIASVIAQTYGNWELCLADGSDEKHENVEKACKKYAARDERIRYLKLEKNMGISGNTNASIDMATGDYIALFDHDDVLHPSALYEVMGAICDEGADYIYTDEATFMSPNLKNIITAHFKPDFAIDNLRANNYICHFSVFKRDILDKVGKFRPEYDGSQDHDMILRLTAAAQKVVHIRKLLYFWRSHPMSVAQDINSKTYAIQAGKNAVHDSIKQTGYETVVESSRAFPTIYRIKYEIKSKDLVSIIIPNKNHLKDLRRCINSILDLSTYKNYEIVIVDNGSDDIELFDYYKLLERDSRIKICSLDIPFNYSKLNNYAVGFASGKYYVLLNNDIEIITPEWIEEMLMYVQREDVGAAGIMLYYPNDTIQHAGVILGLGEDRVAGHAFHKQPRNSIGYMGRLCYASNMSAVTAACMMVKADVYHSVGGLDEELGVAYNDIDFCMKIRKEGSLIVWTPYAEAYHNESLSRGSDMSDENKMRFEREKAVFKARWKTELENGDPYYNPNFTLDRSDFSLK